MGRAMLSLAILSLSLVGTNALRVGNANNPVFNPDKDHLLLYQYHTTGASNVLQAVGQVMNPPEDISRIQTKLVTYPRAAKVHSKEVAADMLEKMPEGSRAWVITMTRSPFARLVSGFFQNLATEEDKTDPKRTQQDILKMDVKDLHKEFRKSEQDADDHFFSGDFYDVTGVNLLDYAFRLRKGTHDHLFQQHKKDGKTLNIILLRFEEGHQNWQNVLRHYFPNLLLDTPDDTDTGKKWYANKYKGFERTFDFDAITTKKLCAGDTLKFYSKEEKYAVAPHCYRGHMTPEGKPAVKFNVNNREYVQTSTSKLLLMDVSEKALDDE